MKRQIVLDTETTGLEPHQGHRIIEIGCVELVDRRPTGNNFHVYLQPDRQIDAGAVEVHGITNEFLADKPRFADIAEAFIDYLRDAEVIIHNAPFDVGFIDAEFARLPDGPQMAELCEVTDTLVMARELHPGQRNSLDALCGRYNIDNTHRTKHGALLDAEILADVYLAMTGGQKALGLEGHQEGGEIDREQGIRRLPPDRPPLPVIRASAEELAAHEARLEAIDKASGGATLWGGIEAG
ncbi:MAG: DNA polymerase III subunit epsilon [Gammaproteobacteria bacterium]|nr:MAG: DNA polymerase III subunit epsilon [Gammaproteobacteria bacterium]